MDDIYSLIDDRQWNGGWYQYIEFPSGESTVSTKLDLKSRESNGVKKWDIIKGYIKGGNTFLDVGCNAGLFLVKASKLYKEIHGVDISEYFLKQCRFVLKQFNIKNATLHCKDILTFDFQSIPSIDLTLMINTLHWIVYSDENGYIEDADSRLESFLFNLALNTKELVLIGAEDIRRAGGALEKTLPVIRDSFSVLDYGTVAFNDRVLNKIHARSKYK